MMARLLAVAMALALVTGSAEASRGQPSARQYCRSILHGVASMDGRGAVFVKCWTRQAHYKARGQAVRKAHVRRARTQERQWARAFARALAHGRSTVRPEDYAGEVVAHPAGCPRIAFCGCGTAVHIFGAPIRALWLAANWFRFPRAEPAPGMVAVRRDGHHVFAIERVIDREHVLAYDPNSGGHLTRYHVVSLRGYRVVNPRS